MLCAVILAWQTAQGLILQIHNSPLDLVIKLSVVISEISVFFYALRIGISWKQLSQELPKQLLGYVLICYLVKGNGNSSEFLLSLITLIIAHALLCLSTRASFVKWLCRSQTLPGRFSDIGLLWPVTSVTHWKMILALVQWLWITSPGLIGPGTFILSETLSR